MTKLTLEELRKLRSTARMKIIRREPLGKDIQILVGMGTCGIAAGAKETLGTFLSSLDEYNLVETVMIRQVGCLGFCHSEPTVEVAVPGMPPIIYGKVDSAVAKEILSKHIVGRQLLESSVLVKPVTDNDASK